MYNVVYTRMYEIE